MKFFIHPDVFKRLPGYKVGVLVVTGIRQPVDSAAIQDGLAQAVTKAQAQPHPDRIEAWEQAFKSLGLNPKEVLPAHISLQTRALKHNQLPSILPLVDLANTISLEQAVPIGTHTLDNLTEDVVIRATTATDTFLPMNQLEPEPVEPGQLAYTSGHQVLTKNLVWRQGETSKITSNTQVALVPIDTFEDISHTELLTIMGQVSELIQRHLGAQVTTAIVTADQPSFEFEVQLDTTRPGQDALATGVQATLTRGVAEVLPSKDSLAQLMATRPIKVYLGIDPTGSLLTLGHSVGLRKLQQFAELGHEVYLLIGNGTVRIGDPTGRDSTRPVLTDEVIEENFKNWQAQASKILDFSKIKIVRNGDWLDKLTYADMVKLMAQTTVQQLIERDMFQDRLAKGLPIHGHEIMYPLLQGYDSVVLDVDLEIGGTDQTFNMMMGRHLQQVYNQRQKWVLSTPIINGTDGRKMSKSYGNFVALTDEPNDMFGKLMRITDDMILEYFTVLTDVPETELQKMTEELRGGANPMVFKKNLAYTITTMYHSVADADAAQAHFEKTIQNKEADVDLQLDNTALPGTALDLIALARPDLSKSELRRLLEQGSVELAEHKLTEPHQAISPQAGQVLKVGKRHRFRLQLG